VDVKVLIKEVYELFKSPGLKKKNVRYSLDCQSCSGRRLYTDKGRLQQILVNLFGNATKFTLTGYVKISGHTVEVPDGEELVISIEDSGIGIQMDKLDAVFERFRQADKSTKKHFGGTGLGLAISKGLTELLGGRIEVSSKPQEGSTFRVIFPLET
jgi:signal transduction histidine kinase